MPHRLLISLISVLAFIPLLSAAHMSLDLTAHCKQLIAFYDRYGASRNANSDGVRNHTRIGAEIDCREGDPQQGVADMEDLLERKRFEVPPIAQAPSSFPQNER